MPRAPRWTDDELRAAVAASKSYYEVCLKLGLVPGNYATLRRHVARLGIDASHLPSELVARGIRRRGWTDDDLAQAVRDCRTVADVMRRLGYEPSGGMHRMIVGKIVSQGLDTTHFVGQSWSRGRRFQKVRSVTPLAEILVVGSTYNTSRLRRRLISGGLKKGECEVCGLSEWHGRPLPLVLDHINGVHTDNRLENLRWDTPASNNQDTIAHGRHWQSVKTVCPRDHLLQEPNLVASAVRNGWRDCLACGRAKNRARRCKARGLPVHFEQWADAYYDRIMRVPQPRPFAA